MYVISMEKIFNVFFVRNPDLEHQPPTQALSSPLNQAISKKKQCKPSLIHSHLPNKRHGFIPWIKSAFTINKNEVNTEISIEQVIKNHYRQIKPHAIRLCQFGCIDLLAIVNGISLGMALIESRNYRQYP
jgi:hypothetical protein